jgi:hypothetical protein
MAEKEATAAALNSALKYARHPFFKPVSDKVTDSVAQMTAEPAWVKSLVTGIAAIPAFLLGWLLWEKRKHMSVVCKPVAVAPKVMAPCDPSTYGYPPTESQRRTLHQLDNVQVPMAEFRLVPLPHLHMKGLDGYLACPVCELVQVHSSSSAPSAYRNVALFQPSDNAASYCVVCKDPVTGNCILCGNFSCTGCDVGQASSANGGASFGNFDALETPRNNDK